MIARQRASRCDRVDMLIPHRRLSSGGTHARVSVDCGDGYGPSVVNQFASPEEPAAYDRLFLSK